MAMIHGIDVSNWQPDVNWVMVQSSNYEFAIVKATESVDFVDNQFDYNWRELKRLGMPRGAYHYARPSRNNPVNEAMFFLSIVGTDTLEPGDMLVLDMEDPNTMRPMSSWSLTWLETIEREVGFPPLFYTYPSYLKERQLTDPELGSYPLWLAAYQSNMPTVPKPWKRISIWQYTSQGSVPGAGSAIDCNWYNGDSIYGLKALGKPGAPTEPQTANEAFDEWCREHGDVPLWRGEVTGKAHWYGRDPQELCRVMS